MNNTACRRPSSTKHNYIKTITCVSDPRSSHFCVHSFHERTRRQCSQMSGGIRPLNFPEWRTDSQCATLPHNNGCLAMLFDERCTIVELKNLKAKLHTTAIQHQQQYITSLNPASIRSQMSGMNISNSSSSSGGGDEYSNSRNEEMENRDYTQVIQY